MKNQQPNLPRGNTVLAPHHRRRSLALAFVLLGCFAVQPGCKKEPPAGSSPVKSPPLPVTRAAEPPVRKAPAEIPPAAQAAAPKAPAEAPAARPREPAARRRDCTPPPRILGSQDGLRTFKWVAPMARHFVLLKYADTPDGGGMPQDPLKLYYQRAARADENPEIVLTDYFSGLKPARLAIIHDGGPAKVNAIREKYRIKADDFTIRSTGYFSDHCFKTKFDEEALFFSILLTDDIALQGFADYGLFEESDIYIEGSPHVPGDPIPRRVYDRLPAGDRMTRPIKAVYLQTMRLSDGTVLDGPKSVTPSAVERWLGRGDLSLAVIGKDDDSPVALAFSSLQFVAVATRTGKIPVFRGVKCDLRFALDVWGDKDKSGAYHLVVTERRTTRSGETDDRICHVGPELEQEAGLVKAPAAANPPPASEVP
jgi:hypothetical protein